jgi:hypothetical protein
VTRPRVPRMPRTAQHELPDLAVISSHANVPGSRKRHRICLLMVCAAAGKKEKEEAAEEEARPSFLPLYRRILRVVMTALFDVTALLVFRIFWPVNDPTCIILADSDGEVVDAVPRDSFVVTITVIHLLHLLDVWVRMSEKDANRRRMMFRVFYSRRAPNSSFKAAINSLEALILVLMVASTWIHRSICHHYVQADSDAVLHIFPRIDLLLQVLIPACSCWRVLSSAFRVSVCCKSDLVGPPATPLTQPLLPVWISRSLHAVTAAGGDTV